MNQAPRIFDFRTSLDISIQDFIPVSSRISSHLLSDPAVIPDAPSKTRILGGRFDNTIPEPAVTDSPRLHLQPFDYDGEVYIGPPEETPAIPEEEEEEEEEEEDDTGNQLEGEELNARGDVFCE